MENKTQSQLIKSILDICEAFEMTDKAISIIRKKCWYLVDETAKEYGNGMDKNTY